jgi:hypothetical protein
MIVQHIKLNRIPRQHHLYRQNLPFVRNLKKYGYQMSVKEDDNGLIVSAVENNNNNNNNKIINTNRKCTTNYSSQDFPSDSIGNSGGYGGRGDHGCGRGGRGREGNQHVHRASLDTVSKWLSSVGIENNFSGANVRRGSEEKVVNLVEENGME